MTQKIDQTDGVCAASRDSRFYIVPTTVPNLGERRVILTDWTFWDAHWEELYTWCAEHDAALVGMTISMDSSHLTLFVLRWS